VLGDRYLVRLYFCKCLLYFCNLTAVCLVCPLLAFFNSVNISSTITSSKAVSDIRTALDAGAVKSATSRISSSVMLITYLVERLISQISLVVLFVGVC